ncbi:MAG TPA: hypothetical protein VGM86_28465 [Thermoanaerobaculia bacterium]|jgi:hypothetical protein
MHSDPARQLLRHTVATLAYRGGKTLRGAPAEFATFRASESSRTPVEILAHIGDLFDWAAALCEGRHTWRNATPGSWESETARFFDGLRRFDEILAADAPLGFPVEKLFQGPVADALTHVGQIAMLRRLAGAPVKGESYFKAEIQAGQVGPEQAAARLEFD